MTAPAKHAHVEETLTQIELAAADSRRSAAGARRCDDRSGGHPAGVFDVVPDFEPLTAPTRLALEWEDRRWAETDPATGYTLFVGCAPEVHDSAGRPAGRGRGMSDADRAAVGGDA